MEQRKKKQCFSYDYYYCYLFFLFMYISYVCFRIIVFNMFRFIFMFRLECPNKKIIISHFLLLFLKPMDGTSYVILQIKKSTYFIIQLILLLFMGPTALFSIIYRSHCTISANFYFYL